MNTTTFDSTKISLSDLLVQIGSGKIQLPDFQRGWVWDDEHIGSLLASVSQSFPIGAIMMMNSGNSDIRFKTRPIEGVILPHDIEPDNLILDGQQRLTSLFLALRSDEPVTTRDSHKATIKRWYYIDIAKALDANFDREEAILSVPEDKVRRNLWGQIVEDYSSPEKEYEADVFPLALIGDYFEWPFVYILFTYLHGWHADLQPFKFAQYDLRLHSYFHLYCQGLTSLNFADIKFRLGHPNTIDKWFPLFLARQGLPSIRFHDLRHTAATLMITQGIDVGTVSKHLGHSKPSVTSDIYLQSLQTAQVAAADKMDTLFGGNIKVKPA